MTGFTCEETFGGILISGKLGRRSLRKSAFARRLMLECIDIASNTDRLFYSFINLPAFYQRAVYEFDYP
jgi:hypothetical protein